MRNIAWPQASLKSLNGESNAEMGMWRWMPVHKQQRGNKMFYVENPNREKPREPTDSKLSLCERNTKQRHQGINLVLSAFARRRLQQRMFTTSLSLSHTLSLSLHNSYNNSTKLLADKDLKAEWIPEWVRDNYLELGAVTYNYDILRSERMDRNRYVNQDLHRFVAGCILAPVCTQSRWPIKGPG